MATMLPSTVTTADGVRLHLQHWPSPEPARGSVVLVHGLGEHVGRYERLALRLRAWGFHVAAYDQRGHGLSGGPRGGLAHADALLQDLGAVLDTVLASLPVPVLLLGHSLGGLVAARYVAAGLTDGPRPGWWRPVDGLVLSSPAFDLGLSAPRRALLSAMRHLTPELAVGNRLRPEWLSTDPEVVRAYVEDPLVHDRITARLAGFILDGGARVRTLAPHWSVATLLMWAGMDRCVEPAGSVEFAAAAPPDIVDTQGWPSRRHEIFNEPNYHEVLDRLRRWLMRF